MQNTAIPHYKERLCNLNSTLFSIQAQFSFFSITVLGQVQLTKCLWLSHCRFHVIHNNDTTNTSCAFDRIFIACQTAQYKK